MKTLLAGILAVLLILLPKISFAATVGPSPAGIECVSAVGTAGASTTATIASVTGQYNFLTEVIISFGPVAAAVTGVATITGLHGGTMSIDVDEPIVGAAPDVISFSPPISSSTLATAIVLNVPAITGGGVVAISACGYNS